MTDQATTIHREDSAWSTLYRVGGAAALIAAILFRRNLGAEVSLFSGQMPPVAAGDWFALLHSDRLLGLAYLNVFDLVNTALLGLLFLALVVALRRTSKSLMTIALGLGLVGVGVYFAANQAFAMLALSERYAAATTEAQRAAFLAVGEALLAINNSGAGALLSLFSVTLAGLIFSIVMRRSPVFGRVTAWLGIVGNGLILFYFVALIFAPSLTFLPHTLGAIPLMLWEILAGWRLFRLAGEAPPTGSKP